jgi:hypothetical protein
MKNVEQLGGLRVDFTTAGRCCFDASQPEAGLESTMTASLPWTRYPRICTGNAKSDWLDTYLF